jgi:hypothetical protein
VAAIKAKRAMGTIQFVDSCNGFQGGHDLPAADGCTGT